MKYYIIFFLSLVIATAPCNAQQDKCAPCGEWRRNVKVLLDFEFDQLIQRKNAITTTVHTMVNEAPPDTLRVGKEYATRGRYVNESDVIMVDANILRYRIDERDQDIDIVLQDPTTKETMVARIPQPCCEDLARNTALKDRYTLIRTWFIDSVAHGKISNKFRKAPKNTHYKVVGVAFWDAFDPAERGKGGAAPNYRSIHPVLDFVTAYGSVVHPMKKKPIKRVIQ
ncbi:MAG: hypothetical protein JSS96_00265 [Bacteroidetes bacterium]|nr:hypothetical protein [Bacteroidota bacterium]